jgi:hypothetical protein
VGVALSSCVSVPEPPPPVSLALVQQRGDIAPGRVQLRVTDISDGTLVITSATLSAAVLSQPGGGPTRRPVTMTPGRTVDLPVLLPAVICENDDVSARATLTLEQGGAPREVTLPVTDELGVLARLSATACDQEAVASVARLSATSASVGTGGAIDLQISIDPVADATAGSLELVALRGTPLLRFPAGTETPLDVTVRASDHASTVTVEVVPQRCDAHAIAEDKVGTLFDLVARVDGREVVVPLERASTVAAALLSATAAVCGLTH